MIALELVLVRSADDFFAVTGWMLVALLVAFLVGVGAKL